MFIKTEGNQVKNKYIKSLKELGCIKVNLTNPWKLKNGTYSPIYINCREIISDVNIFADTNKLLKLLTSDIHPIEGIAGAESAGIPYATALALDLHLPLVYVRKTPKNHGLNNLVEGIIPKTTKEYLLVDDVITDGGSKIPFIKALKENNITVKHCLVIVDREQGGKEVLKYEGVELHSILTLKDVTNFSEKSTNF